MSYTTLAIPAVPGGLNLRDQPDHIDPEYAIDLTNVVFSERGVVNPRYGYAQWSTVAPGSGAYTKLQYFQTTGGIKHILAGDATQIRAIDSAGAIVSTAQTFAGPHSIARYGGPTLEVAFVASGSNLTPIYWNGTAWTTAPAFTLNGGSNPNGKFLAVTPWDNRMVSANFAGTTQGNDKSAVRFSKEGDPLTWNSALWFEECTPGDGEQIMGMIVWRESLYVFKETKFFRFYGTTSDAAGNPSFEYQTINTGVGLAAQNAVGANRDGVYFLSQRGIYRTRGAEPEYLSDVIEPLFFGDLPSDYTGGAINRSQLSKATIHVARERVYISVPTGVSTTNNAILVYSPLYKWWSVWAMSAQAICGTPDVSAEDQFLICPSSLIQKYSSASSTDAGTAIPSRIKFAFWDLGQPFAKVCREMKVWGKGQFLFGIGKDYQAPVTQDALNFTSASTDLWSDGTTGDLWADGTNPADTWSIPPVVAQKLFRRSIRGTVFSVQISDVNGSTWQLDRATFHLRNAEVPSTTDVDRR